MYDMSFRADQQADKDPEDALEPVLEPKTNIGKVHQLLVNFFSEWLLMLPEDDEKLAGELIDQLKPYIREN